MRKIISPVVAGTLLAEIVALAEQDTSGNGKSTHKPGKKKKHDSGKTK